MKILDLSTLLPGPFASYLLHTDGVEVTKVEDGKNRDALRTIPPTEDGVSVVYTEINKNKRIEVIDYRNPADTSRLKQLVSSTDVLIENYRPGRLDKLGFSYGDCLNLNDRIVYCSITSFPTNHPLYGKPAHDLNILALSGYLKLNNSLTPPVLPLADIFTSYEASIAILQCMLSIRPRKLEISMFNSIRRAGLFSMLPEIHIQRLIKDTENILWGGFPCYSVYKTKDAGYVAVAAIEDIFWNDFCSKFKVESLIPHAFNLEQKEEVARLIGNHSLQEINDLNLDCVTPILSSVESNKLYGQ